MAAKRKAPVEAFARAVKAKAARKGPSALPMPRAAAAQAPAVQDELDGSAQQNTSLHKSKSQLKAARKALAAARGKAKSIARAEAAQPGAAEPAGADSAAPDASNTAKGAKPGKALGKAAGGGKRRRTTAPGAADNISAGTTPAAANGDVLTSARHGPTERARQERSAAVAHVPSDARAKSSGEDDDDDDSDDSDMMDDLEQDGAEIAALDSAAAAANGGSAGGAQRAAGRDTAARVPESAGGFRNKEKVLILSSRGIPHRSARARLSSRQRLYLVWWSAARVSLLPGICLPAPCAAVRCSQMLRQHIQAPLVLPSIGGCCPSTMTSSWKACALVIRRLMRLADPPEPFLGIESSV